VGKSIVNICLAYDSIRFGTWPHYRWTKWSTKTSINKTK